MSTPDLLLQTFIKSVGYKLALETLYAPTLDVCKFAVAPQGKKT